MRLLDILSRRVAAVTRVIVVTAAGVMMSALLFQVFARYALGRASSWTEELALFLFTWIVLLAMSACVREGAHVRLVLLLDLAPRRLRLGWERALDLAALGFGVAFAWSGARYVDATLGQVSAAVRYPIEWLHVAAPVAGGLIALHALARMLAPAPPAAS
jgi:TRAP-type C4-dicarboxylate transport system permease small subunit